MRGLNTYPTQVTAVTNRAEEEECAPGQNDPQENEKERTVRLSATHGPVVRAKVDGRWSKSTKHFTITLR